MSDVVISDLMQQLRNKLDQEGIEWHDASEEFISGDYIYHMERTKIIRNGQPPEGIELASCIYGYLGIQGKITGSTYGWPYLIEGWPKSKQEPIPMTVEETIEAVKEL